MSRRTFIRTWNPTAPIGGRGRGRRKKGSDPDQAFMGGLKTVHDPAADARHPGGRDVDGATRFYSASGLTTAGIPQHDVSDRFRATHTMSTRGGRSAVQPRVGMFRNAIQSNVIFGGPSERVMRTSRKKMDRLLAPESDVPESVHEWRRSPPRNTQRRRDVYEYDSQDEEEDEEPRPPPRRRVSYGRRPTEQRKDPDYDPYEFREEDEEEEFVYQPPPRPRRSTSSRITVAPSSSREPSNYVKERLRRREDMAQPRRLFGDEYYNDEEDEEMEEYDRRPARREDQRMDNRTGKRVRELSPVTVPPARHAVPRRQSRRDTMAIEASPAAPAPAHQTSVQWLREQTSTDDIHGDEATYGKEYDANYTPKVAAGIARRILSGLPKLRLKDDDGAESYLSASRSIIAGALQRFTDNDDGDGDPPVDDANRADANRGTNVLRELMNRTQLINVSEEEEEDDDGSDSDARGRFENIFSRHSREDSPVLERLFNQTIRDASNPLLLAPDPIEEEGEVDTAQMLGLADPSVQQQSGSGDLGASDEFALVPRAPLGGESSSSGSASSALSSAHFMHRSMADSHRSLASLAAPPTHQRFAAGGASSSSGRSTDYSSDRSHGSGSGVGASNKSFHFQMGGPSSNSAHSTTAPTINFGMPAPAANYGLGAHNNNDGIFDFEF